MQSSVSCIWQCRMEANYAHQQELDMIPLMMQKDYSPKGYARTYSRLNARYRVLADSSRTFILMTMIADGWVSS